jgi:hypothetical protein
MITKFDFELKLEEIAEKFYFNAATQITSARGGNSRGNEVYFGNVSSDLREKLQCQQIVLPKGECPDSGIFGDFNYKSRSSVNWDEVKAGNIIVIEVNVPNNQKRYLEFNSERINLPNPITKTSEIHLKLNELDIYGEFFGIEYKASKNNNSNSISVASFNSTCPSNSKTSKITKINLIHNLPTTLKKKFENDIDLKVCTISLSIQFSMYYFIVNDEEIGTRSEVRHIFICSGSFFAPNTSEEEAANLSKQIMPNDLGLNLNLYRVKLRYRPFFESRAIKANGFGLYTSWIPKIPSQINEEKQRNELLREVEAIQQTLMSDQIDQVVVIPSQNEDENVIYLDLRAERIRLRSVA